jgi:hypothetical protein
MSLVNVACNGVEFAIGIIQNQTGKKYISPRVKNNVTASNVDHHYSKLLELAHSQFYADIKRLFTFLFLFSFLFLLIDIYPVFF